MDIIDSIIPNYQKVDKLCHEFGLKISFVKIYHSGKYIKFNDNLDYIHTFSNQVKASEIYFSMSAAQDQEVFILWPKSPKIIAHQIEASFGYWNGISVLKTYIDHIKIWYFTSDSNPDAARILMHQREPLLYLINQFNKECYDIVNLQENDCISQFDSFDFKQETIIASQKKYFDRLNKSLNILGNISNLSPREKEVFNLMKKGYSNQAISSKLKLAVRTIEKHKANILIKINRFNIREFNEVI